MEPDNTEAWDDLCKWPENTLWELMVGNMLSYVPIECIEDDEDDDEVTKEICLPNKCRCSHPDIITREEMAENQSRKTCCKCGSGLRRVELAMSSVMCCPRCER